MVTISEPNNRARWRSVEAAALAGLAHAVLYVIAISLMTRAPSPPADHAARADWFLQVENQRLMVTALNLLVLSTIAFLWFVAVIRRRVGERENRFFGTVFLASALLLAALWLVGATLYTAPAFAAYTFGYEPTEGDIALWHGAAVAMLLVLVARLQAVFILTATTVVRLSGAFPRWVVVVGYATGVFLMLVPVPGAFLHWIFPSWVAFLSMVALLRRRA
jgi:hypothetical protein